MRFIATAAVLAVLSLAPAFSQTDAMPAPDWVSVYEEVVKPSATAEYEATTKKMIKWMNDKNVQSPFVHWQAFQTDDMRYIYLIDINDLTDLQKMHEAWMGIMMSFEPAMMKDMSASATRTTDSYSSLIAMRRTDLSYRPEKPRLKPEEVGYIHHDFYYLIPGMDMQAEEVARDWIAALKKIDSPNPFTVYVVTSGNDLPLWVVSTGGKDAADLAAQNAADQKALGSALEPLNRKTMSVVRRVESRNIWPRPDLSRLMKK